MQAKLVRLQLLQVMRGIFQPAMLLSSFMAARFAVEADALRHLSISGPLLADLPACSWACLCRLRDGAQPLRHVVRAAIPVFFVKRRAGRLLLPLGVLIELRKFDRRVGLTAVIQVHNHYVRKAFAKHFNRKPDRLGRRGAVRHSGALVPGPLDFEWHLCHVARPLQRSRRNPGRYASRG